MYRPLLALTISVLLSTLAFAHSDDYHIDLPPKNNNVTTPPAIPIQNIAFDTFYIVQFIALKDTSRTFTELEFLGEVVKEVVLDKNICRYSIGYFSSQRTANLIMRQMRNIGYRDAFTRKSLPKDLLPSEFIVAEDTKTILPLANDGKTEDASSIAVAGTIEEKPIDILQQDSNLNKPSIIETGVQVTEEKDTESTNFSILYTGKSLGVLGHTRFQKEHELVSEYALNNQIKFKLVSHACWRALGLTVFLPSDEPEGHELDLILKERKNWEVLESYPALRTKNVILFEDLDRTEYDMLNIVVQNEKTYKLFPEMENIQIKIYRTYIEDDIECIIVEEQDAVWPHSHDSWFFGEVNRVDFGKTGRLFELPINQGNFDSRITVMNDLESQLQHDNSKVLMVDLGHRNGDLNVSTKDRSNIDYRGLSEVGYDIVIPFEFEFSLGKEHLKELVSKYPNIKFLATNVTPADSNLFAAHHIIEYDSLKVGLIGMVDPYLEKNLPGKLLTSFKFLDITTAGQKAVNELISKDVDVIVAFSNMTSDQNSIFAETVHGVDIIASDLSANGAPFDNIKEVKLPHRTKRGLGKPSHIANNYDYGIAVGKLDLVFQKDAKNEDFVLSKIREQNFPVNDRIEPDTVVYPRLISSIETFKREKGDLMFPAFIDIIEQEPTLESHDETTKHGRMSRSLWEQFMANLLRTQAPAEIAIVRKVSGFLPQIGKLHEREIRSWLWMEDDIVLMDMKGKDIRRLLEADHKQSLVTSGVTSFKTRRGKIWMIMGRFLIDDVYYRLATTNVISHGVLQEYFRWALRVHDRFTLSERGFLKKAKEGQQLSQRDFIISGLKQIRAMGKGKEHHRNIANVLVPPTPYEKLFTFNFVKPTLWTSFNRSFKGEGYESVPESRVISNNSLIVGVEGGLVATLDKEKSAWDFGARLAFAQQSADVGEEENQRTETMDDININLTYRYKGKKRKALHPFARLEYDSEFTSTINNNTGLTNPKQQILRNILGMYKRFSFKWPVLEFGITAENDFSNNHYQYGFQGRSVGRFPLDKEWLVIYSLTNNFNYYLPTENDTNRELSFKYNMIHEVLVPLYGDISLSIGADLFFFKGKTEINSKPGLSMLMRVGVTYNRLWKPKFQSLF